MTTYSNIIPFIVSFGFATGSFAADKQAMKMRLDQFEALMCVTKQALDIAEHTNEFAANVADFAVRSCAKEIFEAWSDNS
jgi:hypothetical protein